MNMKRILTIFLVITALFVLASCGGKEGGTTNAATNESPSPVSAETSETGQTGETSTSGRSIELPIVEF